MPVDFWIRAFVLVLDIFNKRICLLIAAASLIDLRMNLLATLFIIFVRLEWKPSEAGKERQLATHKHSSIGCQ